MNGVLLDLLEEKSDGYKHAEKLHVFIQNLLQSNQVEAKDLSGIAVSKGPGSYTGLRIGVSSAKGLCYALNIPLIALDTLEMLVEHVALSHVFDYYMPVVDARRMEVYRGVYTKDLYPVLQPEAAIIDDSFYSIREKTVGIFGEGAEKCASSLPINYNIIEGIYPSAGMMVSKAYQYFKDNKFEDVAYFEPFYLKEFIAGVSGKKI